MTVTYPTARTTPRTGVFLGWDVKANHATCWSKPEDSIGIVGPPRYGKTSGLIIPSILMWDGPVVSTSTRGDILAFVEARRRVIAGQHGSVFVYDPFNSEPTKTSMHWSPLSGCASPDVCYRRVAAMTSVSGGSVENGDHWRAGAASILRGFFHAAALAGLSLAHVRRWLARQETREACDILEERDSEGRIWADDLEAVGLLGDRERGSFYSVARNALEATAQPSVLKSCDRTDLDIDTFLSTKSSLFILGPSHLQQAIAPLVVGLIDSIAQRAAEVAAMQSGGRLPTPLLLALDEVANIAPLQSLPSLVSEGGGRGIVTQWAVQSLAQLRARYGVEQQEAILAATTAKLIFGGLSNAGDLHNISTWAGEAKQSQTSYQSGPAAPRPAETLPMMKPGGFTGTQSSAGTQTSSTIYRPALTIDALQLLPPLHSWLFYRSDPPLLVKTRPAFEVPEFFALMGQPSGNPSSTDRASRPAWGAVRNGK